LLSPTYVEQYSESVYGKLAQTISYKVYIAQLDFNIAFSTLKQNDLIVEDISIIVRIQFPYKKRSQARERGCNTVACPRMAYANAVLLHNPSSSQEASQPGQAQSQSACGSRSRGPIRVFLFLSFACSQKQLEGLSCPDWGQSSSKVAAWDQAWTNPSPTATVAMAQKA
jgi:hypothetical protein